MSAPHKQHHTSKCRFFLRVWQAFSAEHRKRFCLRDHFERWVFEDYLFCKLNAAG